MTEVRNSTIWKFPLTKEGILMPISARLLTVQCQHGRPVLWAEVDPAAPKVIRNVRVIGTGWADVPAAPYVATFQDGPLVFHVYDLGEAGHAQD